MQGCVSICDITSWHRSHNWLYRISFPQHFRSSSLHILPCPRDNFSYSKLLIPVSPNHIASYSIAIHDSSSYLGEHQFYYRLLHFNTHLSLLLPGEVAVGMILHNTELSSGVVHQLQIPRLQTHTVISQESQLTLLLTWSTQSFPTMMLWMVVVTLVQV